MSSSSRALWISRSEYKDLVLLPLLLLVVGEVELVSAWRIVLHKPSKDDGWTLGFPLASLRASEVTLARILDSRSDWVVRIGDVVWGGVVGKKYVGVCVCPF